MLILNAYGFWRGKNCLPNANLIDIEISNAFCIQLNQILDKTKTEPAQYISICFQNEKVFPHFNLTDLVENDVIDMLIFLLGVLCILGEAEGKLI